MDLLGGGRFEDLHLNVPSARRILHRHVMHFGAEEILERIEFLHSLWRINDVKKTAAVPVALRVRRAVSGHHESKSLGREGQLTFLGVNACT